MKKFLPILFIFLTVFIFFRPTITGKLPIPADTIIGLYNPFRDLYAQEYPRGVPFKNFLITDPVRQQYPWRYLAVSIEKTFQLPLWNPYNFSGYPLLANFQSAALYPPNIVFFVLPFSYAWTFLVILQPLLGGLFMYFYLRQIRLTRVSSILGGIVFAFSGFSIAWMEWNTVLQVAIWLPLVLLIKEKLLQKMNLPWAVLLLIAEIPMILGGHLQTYFYAWIVSNLYLFFRIYQKAKSHDSHVLSNVVRVYLPFLYIGITVFLITIFQWLPGLQFILNSARNLDQADWHQAGWFIPWQHLVQFLVPDFFGNPTTLNYFGVWNYGELVGYIGIFPLMIAVFAMLFRRDKKTLFWGTLFFLSLIFSLPTFFAKVPYELQIPFLSSTQPTRLLFVTDFSLAILSALGLDYFLRKQRGIIQVLAIFGGFFILLWLFILIGAEHIIQPVDLSVAKHNMLLPTVLFVLTVLLLLLQFIVRNKTLRTYGIIALLILSTFDLVRFGQKFESFSPQQYIFPPTKTISFLQQHAGNYRIMATDNRILPPNFSSYYKLQDISGYDPLYLKSYGEFIAAIERNKPDISSPFGFNRIITPKNYNSQFIDLLGVKYILSLSDIYSPTLKKVFQEGETRVYENTKVLPRAFFVESVDRKKDNKDVINALYKTSDLAVHAVREETLRPVITDNDYKTTFSVGEAKIVSYSPNKVVIQTRNNGDGFLVLTDIWYPTWKVSIDGVTQQQIEKVDFTFRGVTVPKGNHTIVFYDTLFSNYLSGEEKSFQDY